jgi:diguanylate cyclase (GGDEF)-like protein
MTGSGENNPREFTLLTEFDNMGDLFYALFQNSPVGTLLVDHGIRLVDANRYVFKYFNQDQRPVKGQLFGNLFNCETVCGNGGVCGREEICKTCLINMSLGHVLASGEGFEGVELSHRFSINGRTDTKYFSVSATPVKHQGENYAVVALVDITERKRREEVLVLLGITDELTGLYNRRFIMEQIKKQVERRAPLPMVIVMLDIDNFKHINDTYGHLVGDDVLRTLSGIIKKSIRYTDYAGRYGGEEFLILLPDSTEQVGKTIVERIRTRLRAQNIDPMTYPVTFSAGVVEFSSEHAKLNDLEVIAKADELMYTAKVNGKDRTESGRV